MSEKAMMVVPWYRGDLRDAFLSRWLLHGDEPFLHMQQDTNREGCGVTKNKGVRAAMDKGADVVVIVDDDCMPVDRNAEAFIAAHVRCLEPACVEMVTNTTTPQARGTPYQNRGVMMPVAASMGFWYGTPDFDAVGQLVYGEKKAVTFHQRPIHGRYFALCGMNLAFRPADWLPWCEFIDVPRWDDIWMGWLWQRYAYSQGHCFRLDGPSVYHSRASNVWQNLREEARHMEASDSLWRAIHECPSGDYQTLRALLPV